MKMCTGRLERGIYDDRRKSNLLNAAEGKPTNTKLSAMAMHLLLIVLMMIVIEP